MMEVGVMIRILTTRRKGITEIIWITLQAGLTH